MRRYISNAPRFLPRGAESAASVGMCVSERKRKTICVLSLSFCLSVRVDACLWILLSAPFNLSLAQVPCPFLLSQSFSSPRPPIHQFTPRAPPLSLPRHYFLLLSGSYIFRPLSTLRSPPFLCSLLSLGLRDLFLFYLSSYYVSQPSLCLTLPGFFSPLSLSYLPCTPFHLHSHISWSRLSFSLSP